MDYQIWGLDPKGFKLTNVLIENKRYDAFVPRVFEDDEAPVPAPARPSRYQRSVFADPRSSEAPPASAPSKTLGSKFRPRRRRRM